ncbi:WxL domain-containing protein [Vagococcus lutrae]|uniref:WxL domain-containing protein n=1 Tax=Vagococcus lutrae TaxID=81947 RepID=UPI00200CD306|nr:WxL domain-containing protein [Vagococcus lutrae]UQF18041.1 WxL domain-containing protein [Vagococcus lutrae]
MKHTKKVVAMMMVGGVVLASATTVKADDSKQTNAQVKVKAGELTFEGDISATAKMNFQVVTFNGGSHTQSLTDGETAVIKVGDYRGNNAKWDVTVKDTRTASATAIAAGTQSFVTGMDITVNPTGDNGVISQGVKTLNNSAQKVFSGGALMSEVNLHPQLTVPGSALAGDYQTVLEWVLSPGE